MRNAKIVTAFGLWLAIFGLTLMLLVSPAGAQTEKVLYQLNPGSSGTGPNAPFTSVAFDSVGNLYGTTGIGNGLSCCGELYEVSRDGHGGWSGKTVYSFTIDDFYPNAGLIFDSQGNMYGTSMSEVFEFSPQSGGAWTKKVLHTFSGDADGSTCLAGLIFDSAGNLYGTTAQGGRNFGGTVFKLSPQKGGTWKETILYAFVNDPTGKVPQVPAAALAMDRSGNLYGTTAQGGGGPDGGTVFELSPQPKGGWRESTLHYFRAGSLPSSNLLIDKAGNLYGTDPEGGAHSAGAVFELSPVAGGGWSFKTLHSFQDNGADGYAPYAGLTMSADGTLYGITNGGGLFLTSIWGTIYTLTPAANGEWSENILFAFDGTDGSFAGVGNMVFDAAGNLYGATTMGGAYQGGVVFEFTP